MVSFENLWNAFSLIGNLVVDVAISVEKQNFRMQLNPYLNFIESVFSFIERENR